MSLDVADSEKEIHVALSYLTSRLSDGQAANVAGPFSKTVSSILSINHTPTSKIGSLDFSIYLRCKNAV